MRVAAVVAVTGLGCAPLTPLAPATSPDACIDANSASFHVTELARTGTHVHVCYDISCIAFDATTSTVSTRELGDAPPSPSLPERFVLESDEDAILLCDRQTDTCSRIRIPADDARTVATEVNPAGTELYAIIASDLGSYLDTYDLRSRRIGRISLGQGSEHMWSMSRVGTALVVVESVHDSSTNTLVAPFTGAIRRLAHGSVIELDANTLLSIEGRAAAILEARTLRAIDTHTAPGAPIIDHSSAAGIRVDDRYAVVAFSNPPSVATVDLQKRRFVSARRLPICEPLPTTYKRPRAPIMNE